jgi:hypothetical protein
MQSSQLPVTTFLSGLKILLSTMFSNILHIRSSVVAKDQVSFAYKTRGKFIVLHALISISLYMSQKQKHNLELNDTKYSPN